jgi:4-aminobutyrate aminotransferase-like enzyme
VEEEMSKGASYKYREHRDTAEEYPVRYCGDFYSLAVEWAEGIYLCDQDGRAILDFSSVQMRATLGHNHPAVVDALRRAGEVSGIILSYTGNGYRKSDGGNVEINKEMAKR